MDQDSKLITEQYMRNVVNEEAPRQFWVATHTRKNGEAVTATSTRDALVKAFQWMAHDEPRAKAYANRLLRSAVIDRPDELLIDDAEENAIFSIATSKEVAARNYQQAYNKVHGEKETISKQEFTRLTQAWEEYTPEDYLYRCFTTSDEEELQIFDGENKEAEIQDELDRLDIPPEVEQRLRQALSKWWDAYNGAGTANSSRRSYTYGDLVRKIIFPYITNKELAKSDYGLWESLMFAAANGESYEEWVENQ